MQFYTYQVGVIVIAIHIRYADNMSKWIELLILPGSLLALSCFTLFQRMVPWCSEIGASTNFVGNIKVFASNIEIEWPFRLEIF